MNTLERLRKGMLLSKDDKGEEKTDSEKEKDTEENIIENETKLAETETDQKDKESDKSEESNNTSTEKKESNQNEQEKNESDKKETHERKISFNLKNKSILPEINIEKPINSLFKLIPSFSIPQKDESKKEAEDNENNNEPEIIVLDNTDESLKQYQQKMIDLREENNFLKNQIKEYVSKVAWLEEHFTIRQENANVQHLQELEHIKRINEKETQEYNDKIKELEDAIEVLQTELTRQTDLLVDEKDTLTFTTSANWSLEKRITEMEDKLKIKNSESIDLKTQLINIKGQLEVKTEEFNQLEEKYNALRNESEKNFIEIEKLRKENSVLSEKFKIYDNISKRSSKSFESRFYNSIYSPTTPKARSNSEYSFNLYPSSNDINSNTTTNKNDISNTNNINNNNNNNNNNINNKPDPIDTKSFSFSQTLNNENSVIHSKNSSFIEDTDLNDLMDEISFHDVSKKPINTKNNIFDFSEPPSEILSENNKKDEPMTQPQNILTEINLD